MRQCPTCGLKGKLEQIGFNSTLEKFFCHTCEIKYVAYDMGNGNLTELIPEPIPFRVNTKKKE